MKPITILSATWAVSLAWAAVSLSISIPATDGRGNLSEVYDKAARAIVRLELEIEGTSHGTAVTGENNKPNGTAFFVEYRDCMFLVTAKHVASSGFDMSARIRSELKGSDTAISTVATIPKGAWGFHPDSGDASTHGVDVAVAAVRRTLKAGPLKNKLGGGDTLEYAWVASSQFRPGAAYPPEPVLVYGYPLDIGFTLAAQRPFARQGIVAIRAEESFLRIQDKYIHSETFVIDCPIFPGNSGSPVFLNRPFESVGLLGLISATFSKLSFAICEPTEMIVEALDYAIKNPAIDSVRMEVIEQ